MDADLVITGGLVVDGTGDKARVADVAVSDGQIVAVGDLGDVNAKQTVDAAGRIVTPGFVDVHTHYDGQVTWDDKLDPSAGHGVTTVVMGNCGVGFAPVRPGAEDWLIQLMEGVEDIPGTALAEGICWGWESFPEYLDVLDKRELAVDVGTQVAHGAVRAYVMGERGAQNKASTAEENAQMADIVQEALEAGALGVSTSRTVVHRALDGEPVPGTFAAEDELMALGEALRRAGTGLFEVAPAGVAGEDLLAPAKEMEWMQRLSAQSGRPVTYAMLQVDAAPDLWREQMEQSLAAVDAGAQIYPQVAARPFGLLMGLQTHNPFAKRPSFLTLQDLSFEDRVARLKQASTRDAILGEADLAPDPGSLWDGLAALFQMALDRVYPLGDPPDYEPAPETSVAARAERAGRDALAHVYDLMLEDDGMAMFMLPAFNYSEGSHDVIREQLLHPTSVSGLSDGGAHCGMICDASIPTYMLTHWARDRSRGAKLDLEWVVKKQTADTASLFGLGDRGVLRAGMRADINVIDFDGLQLGAPHMAHDLPAGGRRLLQTASGYDATIVAGEITRRKGQDTGARPGRLVRGTR